MPQVGRQRHGMPFIDGTKARYAEVQQVSTWVLDGEAAGGWTCAIPPPTCQSGHPPGEQTVNAS